MHSPFSFSYSNFRLILFCFFNLIRFLLVLVFDDAQVSGHSLDVADDLLLNQVEAHGQQGDAEQQVQRAEPDAQSGVITLVHHPLGGHEIPEPDGGERYETEVSRIQEFPIFPVLEQERAHYYVANH